MKKRKTLIKEHLKNQEIISIIEKYLNKTSERWEALYNQLSNKKFYMPIFGVQGSGKSTLLNALIFNNRILPIDARETTCVPTEILYNHDKLGKATIIFKDGRREQVKAKESILSYYIDSVFNPENKLEVERVEVYSDSVLLKNGLVIVDLPGYGSLTEKNQKTTIDYLNKAGGVFFLIRSVPTITKQETYWIKVIWSMIPHAVFCQSCWDTESEEEIEDARDYNLAELIKIKKQVWREVLENPELICVNGEGTLSTTLSKKESEFDIRKLHRIVRDYTYKWQDIIENRNYQLLKSDIERTMIVIRDDLLELEESKLSIEKTIELNEKEFSNYMVKTLKKANEAKKKIDSFSQDSTQFIIDYFSESEMTLRNNMRRVFRNGIVDGERLNQAFGIEFKDVLENVNIEIYDRILNIQNELIVYFEGLEEWEYHNFSNNISFKAEEKKKYENLIPIIFNVGGGIGGFYGGMILGGRIGASIGSVFGSPGVIVGGIVGASIGAFFVGWLGRKGKNLIFDKRIKKLEPKVFKAISDFLDIERKNNLKSINEFANDMKKKIDIWIESQQELFNKQLSKQMEIMKMDQNDKDAKIKQLEEDFIILNQIFKQVERI